MALINRIAISNVLNYHGDSLRAKWFPKFRYECLDFRGHSTAINLTNGGGKTTLAEAIIAVLSRDRSLVKNTKSKMSPKSNDVWSHVQVELIRPIGSVLQNDLLSQTGNKRNGEHWVFGMCGYQGETAINYYYFKGRLEELPIGKEVHATKSLVSNIDFTETRKNIKGLVWSPLESEWRDALSLKANFPLSVIRQLADFQKRGGQDKSALLFDIKRRPGESYSDAFFYNVLAPAIMEGVMDREGEDGEFALEDTVEIAVSSTVRAKRDTEECRQEEALLGECVSQLGEVMSTSYDYEERKEKYIQHLRKIQTDVQVFMHLVAKEALPGIPKAIFPDDVIGELCKTLVVEPGSVETLISNRGLRLLIDEDTNHLNQRADRERVKSTKLSQVIDFYCDVEIHSPKRGSHPEKYYPLESAIKLASSAVKKLQSDITLDIAIEYLEAAFSWFDTKSDTNPFREKLIHAEHDIRQLREDQRALEIRIDDLRGERERLSSRQKMMQANEGFYNGLVESNLFSESELNDLESTARRVDETLGAVQSEFQAFESKKIELDMIRSNWLKFIDSYGDSQTPESVLEIKRHEKNKLTTELDSIERDLDKVKRQEQVISEASQSIQIKLATLNAERKSMHAGRTAHMAFCNTIGISPEENPANQWLKKAQHRRRYLLERVASEEVILKASKNQREVLETELVAPGGIALKAHTSLRENGIAFKPLHHVIEHLDLSPIRKKNILASFSSVLFAPVIVSEKATIDAALVLYKLELQVPIFLYSNIIEYLTKTNINVTQDGQLYSGTTAGIVTPTVECLMDPSLVIMEKRRLDLIISEYEFGLSGLKQELELISEESELVRLAYQSFHFSDTGGPARYNDLNTKLQRGEERIVALKNKLADIERSETSYKKKVIILSKEVEKKLPIALENSLEFAIQFYDQGGPEFFRILDEKIKVFRQKESDAQSRKSFQNHFKNAQRYLDDINDEHASKNAHQKIVEIGKLIAENVDHRDNKRAEWDRIEKSLPSIRGAMLGIDNMVVIALAKYRRVAAMEKDVLSGEVSIEDNDIVVKSLELKFSLSQELNAEEIKAESGTLAEMIREVDIDRKSGELRRSKKELLNLEARFIEEAHRIAEISKALSPVEQQALLDVSSAHSMPQVRTLHEGLLDQLNKIKERVRLCGTAEKESRASVSIRLSSLIEFATNDLHILRQVVSRKYGKHESFFNVNAQILDQKGIEGLINSILDEFDILEQQRRERTRKGIDSSDDLRHQQTLRATIREKLYKNIFSKPSITYVNETIRASGEANEFNEKLSEGQKAALSLMWTIRLAEFAIVREAKRLTSRRAQSKAMQVAENVILIDGLFSNLSDKALIDSAMDGIEATRGRFQLIGLIHNPYYQNDHDKFPVLILGKNEQSAQSKNGWVSFSHNLTNETSGETSIRTAQLRMVKDSTDK